MESIDGFSGSLLVTRADEDLVPASAGVADASAGTVCTTGTRFQIASVSKQLTAAMVMLLVEDGSLDLGDPIGRYLPGCTPRWRPLTLHQLLSHTSGLGHWNALPRFDVTRPGSPEEFLERFASVPLRSAPGATWHYSSPGYLLAARVVETVGGAAYAQLLTDRILRPIGMADTVVGRTPAEESARGYRDGERVDVPEFAAIPGTGDVWSTVDDLTRYTAAFEAGELLSAGARQAMVARQAELTIPPRQGDPTTAFAYGYGYFLGTVCGHRARFHPGDNPGYQSFLGHLSRPRVTIAILCNTEEADLDGLLRQVAATLS